MSARGGSRRRASSIRALPAARLGLEDGRRSSPVNSVSWRTKMRVDAMDGSSSSTTRSRAPVGARVARARARGAERHLATGDVFARDAA